MYYSCGYRKGPTRNYTFYKMTGSGAVHGKMLVESIISKYQGTVKATSGQKAEHSC